jgi:hypothetical protein
LTHGELFAIENEVLLYDVTSTYFEGEAELNPLAQRGYSRDHRSDCKQVLTALVVTFDGFPLGYEVFAGNVHDSKTVQTIVTAMEARHGALGRVWIADRGMASKENLAWLRASGAVGKASLRLSAELYDQRVRQAVLSHVGQGGVVDEVGGVAGVEQLEKVQAALGAGRDEGREVVVAELGADTVLGLVAGAGVVNGDP